MSATNRHEHFLEIHDPAGKVQRLKLRENSIILGRSTDVDVTLKDTDVSRKHAEMAPNELGQWSIRDLDSRNGTYLNGQKIVPSGDDEGWKLLEPGDRIDIATFGLVLSLATPALEWAMGHEVSYANLDEQEDGLEVSVLDASVGSQIEPGHLKAIGSLGAQMVQILDARKRLNALFQFLLEERMHGMAATALRMYKEPITRKVKPLSNIMYSPHWEDRGRFHISRTALRKLLATGEAVLAGCGVGGAIEMSVTPATPMAVMACPLHSDAITLDLIYLVLPPHFGTMDFLAVVALAAQQFQIGQLASQLRTSYRDSPTLY